MAKVEGADKVQAVLRKLMAKADEANVSVSVGYTQAYAIYVHENLEAKHPVGQAKFLEQPFRLLQGALAAMVRDGLRKGQTMTQALLMAGLRLQRESQLLCPVDTGALKGSAFTRVDRG